jgi:hypothetical protein
MVKTGSDHFVGHSQKRWRQPGGYPVELRQEARTESAMVPRQLFTNEAVCDESGT